MLSATSLNFRCSRRRVAAAEQRGGFDLVERAVGGDVTPRLLDPNARALRPWQPHRLCQRLVDVSSGEELARPVVARLRIGRRPLRAMNLDQRAELALEVGPPAVLRAAA